MLILFWKYCPLEYHSYDSYDFCSIYLEAVHLPCRNVIPACLAGTLATFQIGIFLYHVGKEIVLPLREIFPVADNLFGTQAVIFCQRYKDQMKMGRFFIHVDYRRNNIFPAHTVNEEIACPPA